MREEELKLGKIKKSCKITEKTSLVLEIILIVGMFISICGSIACFSFQKEIDSQLAESYTQDSANEIGNAMTVLGNTEIGGLITFTFNTSKMLEDGEYGKVSGLACLSAALVCFMVAAVFEILRRVFKAINISETPFDEIVLKKIKRLFIIICIEILIMVGLGVSVLTGLICWSIFNILDYGFTLQKQIDETL